MPPVQEGPPANPEPSIAPDSGSPLVIRKIQDLIREDKFTPDLERQTGMTKEEAEQFVKKFTKREQAEPIGPGREIKVSPGQEKVIDPNRKAPEFRTSATVSNRNDRSGSSLPQDDLTGNVQGRRSSPPPGLERHVKAYRQSLDAASPPASASPPSSNR
ncbi:hypothetical protein TA3x_000877 [Tundrisphaera sp. TA3]|uniref:hypothetical protein n=1 Tax=Tundrisphaera sp. TA3 TaxID=3435775 RepID=UPI003EB741BD